jgi:hypothetical protein
LDDAVLERALPPAIFYNLLMSAEAPAANGAPTPLLTSQTPTRL